MLLKCEDCMVTFESESLDNCPSCGTEEFVYQLSDNQALTYEKNKLEKKLATAVESLKKSRERLGDFQEPWNDREKEVDLILSEALAEIGGEDD